MSSQRRFGGHARATHASGIQRRMKRVAPAWAGIAAALVATVLSGGSASAQPDYTNVADILHGRRHLLRTDDLVVAYNVAANEDEGNLLLTSKGAVSSVLESTFGVAGLTFGTASYPTVTAARMFRTPYDVAVSAAVASQGVNSTLAYSFDATPNDGSPALQVLDTLLTGIATDGTGPPVLYSAAGDFTGDGLDEIVYAIFFPGDSVPLDRVFLAVATAADPTDPSQGLIIPVASWTDISPTALYSPHPIAVVTTPGPPVIVAVTALDVSGSCATGLNIQTFVVDVQHDLDVVLAHSLPVTLPEGNACVKTASIAAGQFGTTTQAQFAVAYAVDGGNVGIIPFELDEQGNPVQKPRFDTGKAVGAGRAWLRSGQFDWSGTFDQAALAISSGQQNSFQILTFDANLNVESGPVETIPPNICVGDVAVGNFDRMQPNTTPAARNPNPQLAALVQPDCSEQLAVQIFDVNPVGMSSPGEFQVGPGNTTVDFSAAFRAPIPPESVTMAAVDLQGRSLRLGTPTKVVIDKRDQPSVVVATPPMHVDFITPANQTAPEVLNVSAIPITDFSTPAGYYAKYEKTQGSEVTSSTTTSTSWSFGVGETLNTSLSIGDPALGGISEDERFAAQQQWQGSVEDVHGGVTSAGFDVSIATSFGDAIYYDESRLNVYVYPVIGKLACPAANPGCSPGQRVPVTVQFSGVDSYTSVAADGNTTEWYQPPWEPGNVLSYPGHVQQLMALVPNLEQVSDPSNFSWFTDNVPVTENTYWMDQSQQSTASSFDQTYSFESAFSVTSNVDLAVVNESVSGTLDLSGSVAFSRLHTGVTTLQESTGIQISKPGTFLDPGNYRYKVTPFILGQLRPDPVLNTLPLDTPIQTFGMLRTAYVVDPIDTGAWWSQAYTQAPDVALNHPLRWSVGIPTGTPPAGGACRAIGTSPSFDCATLGDADATDPWTDDFHSLRGFFVSEASGQGPQLTDATAGDKLQLQVRVHNYSLATMPESANVVHARFYGTPWNHTTNEPAGPSFLIGEGTHGPIPPFNVDTPTPNWALLGTTFDTSAHEETKNGNVYLTFWVVVWMEDDNGELVAEMPFHGLRGTNPPGTLTSFADAVALEELRRGVSYSNNVGFYKSAFYLFPPPTTGAPPPVRARRAPPAVQLEKVEVLSRDGRRVRHASQNESVIVSTALHTGDEPLRGGLTILFYDGHRASGVPAFDVERMPYLRADDTYDVRVPFRSSICGRHVLAVVADPGTAFERTRQTRVHVKCR